MIIPFVDLSAQYKTIKPQIDEALRRVVASGRFVGGQEVDLFEKEFSSYLGVNQCVAVNSGTDALILGIRALGYKSGSEIIVPDNTFIATALGVSENGLKPVFVDCDDTYGMSLTDLKQKISSRTKAVIVVHLYGQPDDLDGIRSVLDKADHPIDLIEDACQAHGASYRGQKVGSFGKFAAFSFYPGKNFGAYGDAGAIVTDDPELAKKVKLLHEYGSPQKYVHEIAGVNSRMDAIQAAVLRVKLPYLDMWNMARRKVAMTYRDHLAKSGIVTTTDLLHRESVNHLFPIRVPHREELQEMLTGNGVQTVIHYPIPLHLQAAFASFGGKKGDFPNSEKYADELISLPIYPEMSVLSIKYITDLIIGYYK